MSAVETTDAIGSIVAMLPRPRAMGDVLSLVAQLFVENVDLAEHGTYVAVSTSGSVSVGFRATKPTIGALRAFVRVNEAMGGVIVTHRNQDGTTLVSGEFTYEGIPFDTYTTVPDGTS